MNVHTVIGSHDRPLRERELQTALIELTREWTGQEIQPRSKETHPNRQEARIKAAMSQLRSFTSRAFRPAFLC